MSEQQIPVPDTGERVTRAEAMQVPCPRCWAKPGEACWEEGRRREALNPHLQRFHQVRILRGRGTPSEKLVADMLRAAWPEELPEPPSEITGAAALQEQEEKRTEAALRRRKILQASKPDSITCTRCGQSFGYSSEDLAQRAVSGFMRHRCVSPGKGKTSKLRLTSLGRILGRAVTGAAVGALAGAELTLILDRPSWAGAELLTAVLFPISIMALSFWTASLRDSLHRTLREEKA